MINLTPREHDIMKQLLIGKTNKEISEALKVTTHTVKAHLDSIFRKLSVHNRLQASIKYLTLITE